MNTQKKPKGKIARKIIRSILITNLIVLTIVTSVIYFTVNENVGKQSYELAEKEVEAYLNVIDQNFVNMEIAVQTMVKQVSLLTDVNRLKNDESYVAELDALFEPLIKETGEHLGIARSIYVYYNTKTLGKELNYWFYDNADGKGLLRQDYFGLDYYLNEYHSWYHDPMDDGKTLWTFPYISTTGNITTSYITPVYSGDEIIAIVGMDLYLNDLQEDLKEITFFETGHLYLMDENGTYIIHPHIDWNEDGTPKSMLEEGDYSDVISTMNASDKGFVEYTDQNGTKVFTAFGHIGNGWIIASSVPMNEVTAVLRTIIVAILIIAALTVLISIIVALFVGRTISKPILDVVKATEAIRDGDFTVQVQCKSNDETRMLANGLNDMVNSVKALIGEVKHVSHDMVDSATTLASMSVETNATVDQVAITVEEISKGTQETASEAGRGAEVASTIDEKFTSLMKKSIHMQNNVEEAIKVNQSGLTTLSSLKEKSEISRESNEKVSEAVKNLEQRTNAITDIIATISSIADQTNLLALNASIEAARAGEAGKGFAVVADEIRKLAEDSGKATGEISEIVTSIQKDSRETVSVMSDLNVINTEQNVAVNEVNASFRQIIASVENITKEIEDVTAELDDLNEIKNSLVEATSTISAVSEETAAATQEVNASMEEQTKAVEEVAKNAELLTDLSRELNEQIEIFKIN